MTGTNEKTVQLVGIEAMDDLIGLFGVFDENLRVIEEETGTRITVAEEGIRMSCCNIIGSSRSQIRNNYR